MKRLGHFLQKNYNIEHNEHIIQIYMLCEFSAQLTFPSTEAETEVNSGVSICFSNLAIAFAFANKNQDSYAL